MEQTDIGSGSSRRFIIGQHKGCTRRVLLFKLYTTFEFMREQDNYSKFHYTCTGKIGTGSEQIKCYGGEVHGKVDLEKAFAESCNATFAPSEMV